MNPDIYTNLSFELFKLPYSFIGTGDGFEFNFKVAKLLITHNGEKFVLTYTSQLSGVQLAEVFAHHISTVIWMVKLEGRELFK